MTPETLPPAAAGLLTERGLAVLAKIGAAALRDRQAAVTLQAERDVAHKEWLAMRAERDAARAVLARMVTLEGGPDPPGDYLVKVFAWAHAALAPSEEA